MALCHILLYYKGTIKLDQRSVVYIPYLSMAKRKTQIRLVNLQVWTTPPKTIFYWNEFLIDTVEVLR